MISDEKVLAYVEAFVKKYNINRDKYKVITIAQTYQSSQEAIPIKALAWTIENDADSSSTIKVFNNLPVIAGSIRPFYNILGIDYEYEVPVTITGDSATYYIIQHSLALKDS